MKGDKNKKIYIVGGGTGGHIYAALALGEEFTGQYCEVTFFTGNGSLEKKIFEKEGIPCTYIPTKGIMGKNLKELFKAIFYNLFSFVKSFYLISVQRPTAIIGVGGHVCGPFMMAGFLVRVPLFILEQNSVMGMTNNVLSLFSKKVFFNYKQTKNVSKQFCFKTNIEKRKVISGNPIRLKFYQKFYQIKHLKTKNEIQNEEKTFRILVFGGSLGAKDINEIMDDLLKSKLSLLPDVNIEILHQTGGKCNLDNKTINNVNYRCVEYIHDMEEKYLWADCILSRAGASTLSELKIVKTPVILIPYPYHKDKHQLYNAQFFKEENSFPVYIKMKQELIENDCASFVKLIENIYAYKKENIKKNKMDETKEYKEQTPQKIIANKVIENVSI